MRLPRGLLALLAKEVEAAQLPLPAVILEEDDVVAFGVRGREPVDGARRQESLRDDLVEEPPRVLVQLARGLADARVL